MSGITRSLKVSAVAVLVAAAVSGSAMAASAATTLGPASPDQSLNPGQTGRVLTGAVASATASGTNDGAKVDFFAPQGTTFPSSDVQYTKRNNDGVVEQGTANTCALVSPTQISCDWTLVNRAQPAGGAMLPDQYFSLPIQVSPDAAWGTRYEGRMVLTRTGTGPINDLSVTSGESTFGFSTPAQADSPVIDPTVGSIAAAGVLGLGALGFTVNRRRRNAQPSAV